MLTGNIGYNLVDFEVYGRFVVVFCADRADVCSFIMVAMVRKVCCISQLEFCLLLCFGFKILSEPSELAFCLQIVVRRSI